MSAGMRQGMHGLFIVRHFISKPAVFKSLTFRHRASCILGQAFHYSPENAFYLFNQQNTFHYLIFAWPFIIDIKNIDNQLDATITAY